MASTFAQAGRAAAQPAKAQPPVLTAFTINGGADAAAVSDTAVILSHIVVGSRPTEYRVSRRPDFAGASWKSYVDTPTFAGWYDGTGVSCAAPSSHLVTLFFQVRASIGEGVRIVDGQRVLAPTIVESNVMRDTICAHDLRPPDAP